MVSPAFAEAYARLNARQKEAVDTIYGPVIVIAGPGTGKTQMLALRIGNILQKSTGTKPDEILALTYTDSAVATLRTRLASFIGSAAYRVRIHTFHSYARSILELRPDLFPRIAEGSQLSDVSGMELMERLLDAGPVRNKDSQSPGSPEASVSNGAGGYTILRNPKMPYRTAKALFSFMGELKKEHYTPEQYLAQVTSNYEALLADPNRVHESGKYAGKEKGEYSVRRERLEKHIEVAHLFSAYQEALEHESLYDYEDLIAEAVRGLESDEGFRAQAGERSQFVLADEHQDANPAQNKLLELVTDFDGSPNLFVVGDEKQAIYRFQGASLKSFFYFKERYPSAKLISLDLNYRSTARVLAAAHDLIAPAPMPDSSLRPLLRAARGDGGTLQEVVCDTPQEEMDTICAHIEDLHTAGTPYEDIAILTKKNADVCALAAYLRRAGIPEDHVSAEMSALAHPAVQLFLSLIRALTDLGEDAHLARALFLPGLPLTIAERMRILAIPREGKSLARILEEQGGLMREWMRKMKKLAQDMHATPVVTWLAELASESGYVAGLLSLAESEEAYEAYQGFMEEAALLSGENPSATAPDLLARLATIEKHELRVKRARTKHAGVRVMTAHSAKGLEFSQIIIAHATDEKWLRGKSAEFSLMLDTEDDEHDMRRLFYVALTRAKDGVLITHADVTTEDRAQTPLRFLSDMSQHFSTATLGKSDFPKVAAQYETRTILDTNFLKERLLARGFSPTGFNNYVQSPWQYYFRTLLMLPSSPELPMLFGTAMHAGLKVYADTLKNGEAHVESAIASFYSELNLMPLLALDRKELMKKGEEALRAYIAQEGAGMTQVYESEFSITTSITVPGVGEVPLSGKLDRLDLLQDGTVTVIDYKTGKARSENDIKGLTKSSDGGYYRQLVFYKLLIDRDRRYTMSEAALHFVEPDDKGKCFIRKFTITSAEVSALEAELIEAAKHIADGSAFTAVCDSDKCDYCDLVGFLTKD